MNKLTFRISPLGRMLSMGMMLMLISVVSLAQELDMKALEVMKPRNIGPAGMSGRVTAIDALYDNPDIIYAGTASGGLWKSESGGIAWTPIFDEEKVYCIGDVTVYQANPDIIWVGTGEGNPRNSQNAGYGVYKSLDGGKTWTCMGLEDTRNIHRVLIHPNNPDIVYVGAQGPAWGDSPHRGVYKTTDGGKTWDHILEGNDSTGIADMVMDPSNPNKLIAAMWQFRRKPWTFTSGGPHSGLYVTVDGGETWERRTAEDGLPQGNLGRIGLAIAPSDPDRVYALVEAKKNGFYRSDDGGRKWRLVNSKSEIGNRPFYYSDIFVDPKNENRVYSLHSLISRSEDGGKSFQVIVPFSQVHPDHHAFWIHPENPNLLMNGNDGGMAISRDRGKNWRFIENLPLAQYYHINIDNEIPYNVYGGMQDNGSWRGPAYVWRAGGIRNSYFEELYFGDGFDVVPDPADAEYGYAMSQGGFLGRYHVGTGFTQFIRPIHPEGTKLRFNWNAGIAQDPFDAGTIYYGSQFVHKSTDRGNSWEIISDDLTTNDPEKQKQAESGGLTLDVTAAENHTSILSIAPSPVEQGVMWVGTDDGNLHLTRDGGKSWTKLNANLPGLPANAWFPHIHPSTFEGGEAFVVVNNYRQNDYRPFLYHTRDYGQTWRNLVDDSQVFDYTLSVVQDPIEKNLIFLGAERGLYVSVDGGSNWTKWTNGYPSASTMDLKIHPREHDLVMGTFGRAAWILDDIRPLRELARAGLSEMDKPLKVYPAPDAYMVEWRQAAGVRFIANGDFVGQNRWPGAMLSFSTPMPKKETPAEDPMVEEKKKKKKGKKAEMQEEEEPVAKEMEQPKADSVTVEIMTADREVIRTLKMKPKPGLNRMYWGLDSKGVKSIYQGFGDGPQNTSEPGGGPILPGAYTARFTMGDHKDSTTFEVHKDPRLDWEEAGMKEVFEMNKTWMALLSDLRESVDRIQAAEKALEKIPALLPEGDTASTNPIKRMAATMGDSLKAIKYDIITDPEAKGIIDDSDLIGNQMFLTSYYLGSAPGEVNPTHELAMEQMKAIVAKTTARIEAFFEAHWEPFQTEAQQLELSPFHGIKTE